jgi:hypothetical protein
MYFMSSLEIGSSFALFTDRILIYHMQVKEQVESLGGEFLEITGIKDEGTGEVDHPDMCFVNVSLC